ncbi:hypothetical protein F5Y18DRAFT_444643 [Xylariaceae sp. FL1019]|nr:hypothetical protein F5Y18DRAFT_444643 [Xylariaceae sp. FL1019]
MPRNQILDDSLVTNWKPYFHRDGTLRRRATVRLDCQICTKPLAVDHRADGNYERYTVLCCGHVVGLDCMRRWVHQSPTCPICRKNLEHRECKHIALAAFEYRANFNIHRPPYGTLDQFEELNERCIACNGNVTGDMIIYDESDDESGDDVNEETEHNTQQGSRAPPGQSRTYHDHNIWPATDNQLVYDGAELETIENMMINEVMALSLQEVRQDNLRDNNDRQPRRHRQRTGNHHRAQDRSEAHRSRRPAGETSSNSRRSHRHSQGEASTGNRQQHRDHRDYRLSRNSLNPIHNENPLQRSSRGEPDRRHYPDSHDNSTNWPPGYLSGGPHSYNPSSAHNANPERPFTHPYAHRPEAANTNAVFIHPYAHRSSHL